MARLTAGVLARPDALGAKDVIEAGATVGTSVDPLFDGFEHGAVGIATHVTEGRMVEDVQAVVQDLVFGDVDMLPSVEHARGDIFQDCRGHVAGGFVEDVGEMVLGQERVGGIGALRVRPGLELMPARGLEDARRAGL